MTDHVESDHFIKQFAHLPEGVRFERCARHAAHLLNEFSALEEARIADTRAVIRELCKASPQAKLAHELTVKLLELTADTPYPDISVADNEDSPPPGEG